MVDMLSSNGGGALRSGLFSSSHLSMASLRFAKGLGPSNLIMSSLASMVESPSWDGKNKNVPSDNLLFEEQLCDLLYVVLVLVEQLRCPLVSVTGKDRSVRSGRS